MVTKICQKLSAKNKKYFSKHEALARLQRYCVYQDRCHQDVRNKLLSLEVYGDTLEQVIAELIEENFLNEERFARSFARGKFRIKNWGRGRIIMELKARKISSYCVKKALEEIPEEDYLPALRRFMERKKKLLRDTDLHKRRNKLAQYALRRGWEPALVWPLIRELENDR